MLTPLGNLKPKDAAIIAAVGLVLAYLITRNGKAIGEAIGGGAVDLVGGVLSGIDGALPEPIRPSSDKNVVYGGVNTIGGAVTGQGSDFRLGVWLYDITHGGQ